MPNEKETMSPELIAAVTDVINSLEWMSFEGLLAKYLEKNSDQPDLTVQDLIEDIIESGDAGEYLHEGGPEFENIIIIGATLVSESL